MSSDGQTVATLNKVFLCNSPDKNVADEEYAPWQKQNIEKNIKSQLVQNASSIQKGLPALLGLPVIRWQYDLITLGHYIAADLKPSTKNESFLVEHIFPIWEQLISKAYFGEIYVGYGEDLIQIERRALEADGQNWFTGGKFYQDSKFRIYVKDGQNNGLFRSVWTNVGNLPLNPERLVRMELGERMENFLRATYMLFEKYAGLESFFNAYHTAQKQIVVDVQDGTKFEKEMNHLQNSHSCIHVLNNQGSGQNAQMMNDNDWDEFKTIKLETVDKIANWNDMVYGEHAAKLGIFGKDSTRGAKQDNIQSLLIDMKMVNNMRAHWQTLLQGYMKGKRSAFGRTFDIWPHDFDVYLNSASPHEEQKEYKEDWINKNRAKYFEYKDASTQGEKGKDFISGTSNNK